MAAVGRSGVHRTVPPSVEYDLTPLGRTFLGPLSALADWAALHGPDITAAREHHDARALYYGKSGGQER
jgi:DNA-binding HxlR family transcriptional regulator